ncbi:MAG: hypothetical protein A2148_08425 [Chloroflexi bacterium RBG_16_68_14]|nr:MAG: hypothetical protein A2148_08425 [Chloroflexi bacterium RBG_16_68_14]
MTQAPRWNISGEYFENCNCDVVCPCEVSPAGFLGARPDQGYCDVFMVFHVNEGSYGDVALTDLNLIVAAHAPGVMSEGNWTAGIYIDERASPPQQEALGAIFSGAVGGPMSAIAPLIGQMLGVKAVPISYKNEGRKRSATIPGILDSVIEAVPSPVADSVVIKKNAHPFFLEEWVQASGVRGTYQDYDFRWDNTGKCADYSPFRWAGP